MEFDVHVHVCMHSVWYLLHDYDCWALSKVCMRSVGDHRVA